MYFQGQTIVQNHTDYSEKLEFLFTTPNYSFLKILLYILEISIFINSIYVKLTKISSKRPSPDFSKE